MTARPKRHKRIPVHVVEEHNDALQFIYSAIGSKRLPLEGTTLLHLDAHPDMLIDRELKGEQARAGRQLLPLLQIENWIVPAVAAGFIGRVVWLRPPWASQFSDGTRTIEVGDNPETGLLRVDNKEPYYLSDALYSSKLINTKKIEFTVAELSSPFVSGKITEKYNLKGLIEDIDVRNPFVLDIDLDFFSTGNPFLSLYENINLYNRLEPIFEFKRPEDNEQESLEKVLESRVQQLNELKNVFQHLEECGSLQNYEGERTELFNMVSELADAVASEAERVGEAPDWWAVYAAGCTRDQGGLPFHISTEEEIRSLVEESLKPLLLSLPPPVLITIARSTEDGYCPSHQVEMIQSLVFDTLKNIYETEEPQLHYLPTNEEK